MEKRCWDSCARADVNGAKWELFAGKCTAETDCQEGWNRGEASCVESRQSFSCTELVHAGGNTMCLCAGLTVFLLQRSAFRERCEGKRLARARIEGHRVSAAHLPRA